MEVVQVTPDATMMIDGYEHRILHCTLCGERERRLVFRGAVAVATQQEAAPLVEPELPPEGAWARALKKLRDQQQELSQRTVLAQAAKQVEAFSRDWEMSFRSRPAEPVPAKPANPAGLARRMRALMPEREAVPAPPVDLRHASSANKWERAIAKLGGRRVSSSPDVLVARRSRPDEFDRIWNGSGVEGPAPNARSSAGAPSAAQSRSLVPVVTDGFGLWAQAIVLPRGGAPPGGETIGPRYPACGRARAARGGGGGLDGRGSPT
jgi:hypothetical protein